MCSLSSKIGSDWRNADNSFSLTTGGTAGVLLLSLLTTLFSLAPRPYGRKNMIINAINFHLYTATTYYMFLLVNYFKTSLIFIPFFSFMTNENELMKNTIQTGLKNNF